MPTLTSSHTAAGSQRDGTQSGANAQAMRLPMPVPLLFQLLRPINSEHDVDSLAAHLDCARARGCF
ncbi:MAG: hypothetical protein V4787_04065 [Pseudomonadota bacterium]